MVVVCDLVDPLELVLPTNVHRTVLYLVFFSSLPVGPILLAAAISKSKSQKLRGIPIWSLRHYLMPQNVCRLPCTYLLKTMRLTLG